MKSLFRKSAISLLVMGVAGVSYAAMPNHHESRENRENHENRQNQAMWSPRMNGWFIGVDGLDLRPENGDLDYVSVFPFNASNGGAFYNRAISPNYQWSWRFYGGIKFTDNDDITLSWMRMRADDSSSTGIIAGTDSAPRFLPVEPWTSISSSVNFDLDEVYGVWGHTINFNNPWSLRFAGGLEYAKLDSDLSVNADDFNNTSIIGGFTADSHLKGFGPRVELDMTYHLPYNLALFANANAALLASTRKISIDTNADFDDSDFTFNGTNFTTRHVVVPKFGARLGVSYSFVFGQSGGEGCGSASALTIDAGWQVESYIHAIERPENGFSTSLFATTKVSNFGDEGWFVGLKYSAGWL